MPLLGNKFASPRTRRNISKIFPFGIIYLVTTWVFLLVEVAVNGSFVSDNYFVVSLNVPMLVFITIVTLLVGFLIGTIEVIWFRDLFKQRALFQKIVFKLSIYVLGSLLVILIFFPIAVSLEYHIPPWHKEVAVQFADFLRSMTFYSSLLQMAFTILLCLIYASISENLGHAVLMNFFMGKYHRPKEERRIFMFLDMNASTTLAERLGHIQYFKFLSAYYDTFSNAIIDHFGEVYQYIGDEIIISWPRERGLLRGNCVRCFFAMQKALESKKDFFLSTFGLFPKFKAALHEGRVTVGEIGALKKEITFSGDVLNVTSRIQGLCNKFDADLLVSGSLMHQLSLNNGFHIRHLGEKFLKGREESVELNAISLWEPTSDHMRKNLAGFS